MLYNEDKEICRACGGQCCKTVPGAILPGRIGGEEKLVAMLNSGNWCVWDIDNVLIVRPRVWGQVNVSIGPWDWSGHGQCVFLGRKGCVLSWEERPDECCGLVPDIWGSCLSTLSVHSIKRCWSKKQALVAAALARYDGVSNYTHLSE